MNYYNINFIIALSITCFTTLAVGVFVFLNKIRDRLNFIFFLYSLSVAWWCFFQILSLYDDNLSRCLFWTRTDKLGVILIPTFFLHFIIEYLKIYRKKHLFILVLSYLISFFYLSLSFTGKFVDSVTYKANGLIKFGNAGQFYLYFVIFFLLAVGYSTFLLFKEYRFASGVIKKQISILAWGALLGYIGGGSVFLLFWNIDPFPIVPFGIYGIVIYYLMMTYAVLRFRFLDINVFFDYAQQARLAAIGTLAAGVNHEVKNPLYVIKGLAEAITEQMHSETQALDKSKVKKNLNKMLQQIQRATNITQRLTDFTRPYANKPKAIPINIRALIKEILQFLSYEVRINSINVNLQIGENANNLLADRGHVQQIIFNLIRNACQEMNEGGTINIKTISRNEKIELQIADTGNGIDKQTMRMLFEPFSSSYRKTRSQGLGLYISKQLIELNKGKIYVTSKRFEGTTFHVILPSCSVDA